MRQPQILTSQEAEPVHLAPELYGRPAEPAIVELIEVPLDVTLGFEKNAETLQADSSGIIEAPLPATEIPKHSWSVGATIRIGDGLYKPVESLRPKKEEFREKVDSAALHCQSLLHKKRTKQLVAQEEREVDVALHWLGEAVEPAMAHICRSYKANARYDHGDFKQTMREHMFLTIVPQYKKDKGSFYNYFKSTAWKRVQQEVGKNMSYFTTPQKGTSMSSEDIAKAFNAFSYHVFDTEHTTGESGENSIGHNKEGNQVHALFTKEVVDQLKQTLQEFSDIERIAFDHGIVMEEKYAEIARKFKLKDAKSVENAVQRVRKKFARDLAVHGLDAFDVH